MARNTLAVVSQSGQSLTFFNLSTGEKTGQVTDLKAEPHELCYDNRTNLMYITHAYRHGWYAAHGDDAVEISVFDCEKRKVVDIIDVSPYKGPHYTVLDTEHDILYSSVEGGIDGAGGIIGIDLKTHKITKAIPSGYKTHWFVMTPDGRKAFTCNKEAGFISVIDLVEEKMTGKLEIPGGCEQPGISNDGKLAYFPTPGIGAMMKGDVKEKRIQVIDTTTDEIVKSIPLDYGGITVHVDCKERLLVGQYVFEGDKPNIQNLSSMKARLKVLAPPREDFMELATFDVDPIPLTVYASPDGSRAFSANIIKGTVSIVNLDEMKYERTLDVDTVRRADKKMHQGAHGMALI
ncbi:hypothetical protein M409DRAFT_64890 [Zasmidium cellare ATCC 36951]|uniref:SMP-30/Gluconolactonase/LRE-like region domain-containing protein n=1 Tax=Zasmidium cellare ATCC 36951 TaxID=1080233 RepID=A0A6A6CTK6_ZASCE|nr:uncharacterized protein M409DRAFT_64890 [Zasmidium cellare ATCC 36951]KAF2169109.1 hypothetical protein M409DRAFT_64890 [Zasmidium cellare ATCC 36951]